MNPIDDFFQDKLKNHEVKPSDRANQLFMSKLENKKKKKPVAYWYFGLAASLFIVSFVGVYYYNTQKTVEPTLATLEPTNDPIKETPITNVVAQEHQHMPLKLASKSQNAQVLTKEPKIQEVEQRPETPIFSEKIAQNEAAKLEQTAQEPKIEKSLGETLIFLTPILAMNQVTSFNPSPKISENTNTANSYTSDEYFADDKSLLTRVLDEVKNLKKGEKVDFNKLGFKPIEELALDKDGFIVSETNQIKDKINWIRTRLNNN